MSNFIKLSAIIILCINFAGCTSKKSSKYFYLPEYEALDGGYPYGAIVYKSSEEGAYKDVIIGANVIDFKSDRNLIIVKQKPDEELLKKWIGDEIAFVLSHKKSFDTSHKSLKFFQYKISVDSILRHNYSDTVVASLTSKIISDEYFRKILSNDINYWIIHVENDSLTGPFNELEFNALSK